MLSKIILQIVLILFNAIFACAEIAMISINDAKLEKGTLRFGTRAYTCVVLPCAYVVKGETMQKLAKLLKSGGSVIVIGNELGAGKLELAKQYGQKLFKITIISGIILGLIAAASAPMVLYFLNLTETAEHYLFIMLMMCSYYILGRSINSTLIGGIFSAGGDTKFGFICDSVTMWAFIVPIGFLAAFVLDWPVMVVYFLLNLDEIIKIPVVIAHYRKYKWVRNIINEEL